MRAGCHPSFPLRGVAAVVAAIISVASLPPLANAQEKPPAAKAIDKKTRDAAKKAFDQGQKSYEAGDYAAAYDSFKKANETAPSPQAELWMALSLSKQQDKTEEAVGALEAFLNHPEASKVGDERMQEAQAALADLKAKLVGTLMVVTEPPGATVTVDGTAQVGKTPIELNLAPGSHKVVVAVAGHQPQELDIEISGGEKLERQVALPPEPIAEPPPEPAPEPPPVAPPPAPEPEKRSKVPAYITLGIAGVGAAVGTIFGLKALSAKSDFNDSPSEDMADEVERNALFADIAFGVAITVGITGVVLLTSSDEPLADQAQHKLPSKPRLAVTPYVGPKGGGAAARVSF